jgi:hypothetical protein
MGWKPAAWPAVFALALLAALAFFIASPAAIVSGEEEEHDIRVKVEKKSDEEKVEPGEVFHWLIKIEVKDAPSGTKIKLEDELPKGFEVLDVDPGSYCDEYDNEVECEFEVYGDETIWVDIKVKAPDHCGRHTNYVTVEWKIYEGGDAGVQGGNHGDNEGKESDSDSVEVECEASITITKDTDPEDDGESFSFSSSFGSFNLKDDQSKHFQGLDSGTYTFVEAAESDWELLSIVCSGSGHWVVDLSDHEVKITVDDDEHVTCEFNNIGEEDPPVVVVPPVVVNPPVVIIQQPPQVIVQQPQVIVAAQPTPRTQVVAALPRTGDGSAAQQSSLGTALPIGLASALLITGAAYAVARRKGSES